MKPNTIVSYYPGAGGHRYLRWNMGAEFNSPGVTYDSTILKGIRTDSYMLDEVQPIDGMLTTHCVNIKTIRSRYPTANVVYLDAEFSQCLCREWMLAGNGIYAKSVPDQEATHQLVDSAFNTIVWHSKYYQQYPLDLDSGVLVVDIATDSTEFGAVMRDEFTLCQSDIFNIAWRAYQEFGDDAPIIDIFDASAEANKLADLAP